MGSFAAALPIIIDCLIAILLVVSIVLVIKLIGVVDDARLLIDNIMDKVNTVNSLFSIIKKIDVGINGIATKLVDIIENAFSKIGNKSKSKKSEEEDELEEILKGME